MKIWWHIISFLIKSKLWIGNGHDWGFLGGSVVKNSPANEGDPGSIPDLGRSPAEGNGNLLKYSCLGNPMDRGAWQATIHGLAQTWTQLSNWTTLTIVYKCFVLESSVLWVLFWRYLDFIKSSILSLILRMTVFSSIKQRWYLGS